MKKTLLTLVALGATFVTTGYSQVSLDSFGNYLQNFTGYTAFDAAAQPVGWSTTFDTAAYRGFTTTGAVVASGFNGTSGGSITSGGLFSWGELLDGPPASIGNSTFAWQGTGTTANMVTTVSFLNNTGSTITALNLSFDVYQWRKGSSSTGTQFGRLSTLDLAGSANLTGLNSFNFTAQNHSLASQAAVGRAFGSPAPSDFTADTSFSQSLTGLNIANGDSFSFSFTYDRGAGSGSAQGIALDNFSLAVIPEPATWALLTLGLSAVALRRKLGRRA